MIPIKLTLHNFMPYRDTQTLDFSGIHTASICGDNGSGKSAIIDAITWALWGETRAKRDDDLVHQGETEMEVDFEFVVADQRYRVLRRYARPKRQGATGQPLLHLYIAGDGGFRTIDGDTKTQTQHKIVEVLHMDYDTFVNSAYLRQGHADAFTTATPSRRKEVLGAILGLAAYETLAERARAMARQRDAEREHLTHSLAEMDADLAQVPACEAERVAAEGDIGRLEDDIRGQESALTGLRKQREELEAKRAQLTLIERGMAERTRTLRQVETQVGQLRERIREHDSVITRREEIESGYARFITARDQNDALGKKALITNRLTQKRHDLELAIARANQVLVREQAQAQGTVSTLQTEVEALPRLREDLAKSRRLLEQLAGEEEGLKQRRQDVQQLMAQVHALDQERARLEKELEGIAEKLRLLRTQKGATCPLCGCALGEDGLQHIESEFAAERLGKADAMKAAQAEAQVKQTELKTLVEATQLTERQLSQERGQAQGRAGALEREAVRAEQAAAQLAEVQAQVREIEERMTARDFAAAEQEQMRQVDAAFVALDYDPQVHDRVRQEYEAHRQYETPRQQLDEAERLIAREREDMAGAQAMAEELRAGLEADAGRKQSLAVNLEVLPALTVTLSQAEAQLRSVTAQRNVTQERLGSIKGKLVHLQEVAIRRKEREAGLRLAAEEAQVYEDLGKAFSKSGVQGLIIETAVPEIENEANRLLARMTDNRMNVKFEMQRPTQKGDAIETLDIKISDELGTRNYELFSGGEAFRIDFSIRIALSRLLARRAGAPLPTLIIDEGFGTQDQAGIEKLREAITTIQDDFEKVLVITHIEELRDAFPARIEVVKEEDGSRISLG